jgi:SAM-dependent methyltransferase
MGGINQVVYVVDKAGKEHRRVLEIGSKEYGGGTSMKWRENLTWDEYVGLDMSPGENVDAVGNLEEGLCGLPENSFDFILCCSVLEHTQRPWEMAKNITKLLSPGGIVYVNVPWVWRYHGYPQDNWRISYTGIKVLFPDLELQEILYNTYKVGEFFPCTEKTDTDLVRMIAERKYCPYLEVNALGRKPLALPTTPPLKLP